ncbi:GNAT family N-acetyltransferase [Aquabacterium humicola]|uniref:GNAT family N-acetyltransferase n=1 Tax=Aquabacterium humicola TaxID=3237377 RepID=UPI00254392DC|nr:GNAT family N-acetyltransferase [Rubrivivax pictus]
MSALPLIDSSPHAPVVVRDAADADLPTIAAIYAHHVLHGRASFEEAPPDVNELRRRLAAVQTSGLPWLVAELDGRHGGVAGYAYATPYRPRPAYRHTIEDSVYVAPELAGRGIGRALLRALIARCERGPWRQMLATVGHSGNAGSIGLHRSAGFELVGTLRSVGFKLGEWTDTVLMQRSLGPGDTQPPSQPG